MHFPASDVRTKAGTKAFFVQAATVLLFCLLVVGAGSSAAQLPTAAPTTTLTLPTLAEVAAYNAARTPQISVTLAAGSTPITVATGDGILTPIFLPSSPTPVVIVLTYPSGGAGQVVWVQMLQGGTLTAIGPDGKTYDGSRGFFLTLGALNSVAFTYQAPNNASTYQVLTRFSNVLTVLPFTVSAPAQ